MSKKLKKKNEKIESIHVRVTMKEKRKISKEAEKLGVRISEYIRMLIVGSKINKVLSSKEICAIVMCQDIVTYVQEKYGCEDDEELERRVNKLWKVL